MTYRNLAITKKSIPLPALQAVKWCCMKVRLELEEESLVVLMSMTTITVVTGKQLCVEERLGLSSLEQIH
jgi:hypothetical protein